MTLLTDLNNLTREELISYAENREDTDTIEVMFTKENGDINLKITTGIAVAYDGCHKLYIIQDAVDMKTLLDLGYDIYNTQELQDLYENSCELRFINTADLSQTIIPQGIKSIEKFIVS